MFGLTARAFRFGNVVGPRQTHGITFDFTKKLLQNSSELTILGNGTQSKSYIHVYDVINAVLLANAKCNSLFDIFNVATGDYITVKEIAELTVECLNIQNIKYNYTGGDRGWKGDVPIVRLNTDKIKSIGWQCYRNSKEALKDSVLSMVPEFNCKRM
jgi:UDP-glucose 4-epimerase